MADYMREALMTLMGKEALDGEQEDVKYSDGRVCRDFLCGLCPHSLFVNTKSDVGACPKMHSDRLKAAYERDHSRGAADFGYDHYRSLMRVLDECDRKVQSMQRRIKETAPTPKMQQLTDETEQVRAKITGFVVRVEELGAEGRMVEALTLLDEVDRLQRVRLQLDGELKTMSGEPSGAVQQKLRVCDVCAAYLSAVDSDRRLADHFIGKTHMGYRNIRDKVEQLEKIYRGGRSRRVSSATPPAMPSDTRSHGGSRISDADSRRGSYNHGQGRRDSGDHYGDRYGPQQKTRRRR